MKTSHRLLLLAASLLAAGMASAQPITIDTVFVGDAGNDNDSTGFGGVSYGYHISTTPVTNAQYTAFLNAVDSGGSNPNGIYNSNMGSDIRGGISFNSGAASGSKYAVRTNMGNKPVNFVSWFDAARFTNWLHNGQGSGSTETGAYTLNNATSGIVTKNVEAIVWIPSENEWYKAAYYDPTLNDGDGGYWLYPTQSNTAPTQATVNSVGDVTNPGMNVANYDGSKWTGGVTTVGSAESASHYGTFDQGGNVWEWNDAIIGSSRGLRGGSFNNPDNDLRSSFRDGNVATLEDDDVGFRVTSLAAIPEPSTYAFGFGVIAMALAAFRRMRIRKGQS